MGSLCFGAGLSVHAPSALTEETRDGDAGSQSVATDETHSLIASNKVEGTAVYNRGARSLGQCTR
jgi:hypothetical protein